MSKRKGVWKPDSEQIKLLEAMAGLGMTERHMADAMGVSLSTFQLAEKKSEQLCQSLSKARSKALNKIAQTAYQMATSGKDTAMTIFLCKTRLRWKEPASTIEHTGADGAELTPQIIITMPDNGRSAKK